MKKLLIALMVVSCITVPVTGCKNTKAQETVYKVEGGLIYSVDAAMKSWAEYCNAGHASPDQKQAVKAAYVKYYDAQQLAKVTLKIYVTNTNDGTKAAFVEAQNSVTTFAATLLSLISSFKQ